MFAANIQQVYKKTPEEKPFDAFVLLLTHKSETKNENFIRKKHGEIDQLLMEQNVMYAEITTRQGRATCYELFNCQTMQHPLFIVLTTHPKEYHEGNGFLIIPWGEWCDENEFRAKVMAFIEFFSNPEFRQGITTAKQQGSWDKVKNFFVKESIPISQLAVNVLCAICAR